MKRLVLVALVAAGLSFASAGPATACGSCYISNDLLLCVDDYPGYRRCIIVPCWQNNTLYDCCEAWGECFWT